MLGGAFTSDAHLPVKAVTGRKAVVRAVGAGDHALKAIAERKSGRRAEATLAVKVDPKARRPEGKRWFPGDAAAIAFVGDSRCGVENLTLAQTQQLWTNGVYFCVGWECWARGVTVLKAGRFPLHATWGKWCEIRDCVADDAWEHEQGDET